MLVGFEPRPPDCSGCKVSGLQHGLAEWQGRPFLMGRVWDIRFLASGIQDSKGSGIGI